MKALLANRTYLAAKTFAYAYLLFTLCLSFSHQIALFAGLGSHTPWVAPILTDTMMVYGKMLRSPRLSAGTRRTGLILQLAGSALSLAGNILAGDNTGDRIIGVLTIVMMLVFEVAADHTKPAERDTVAAKAAKTAAAVAKAQATRAAKKAAADKAAADAADKAEKDRERRRQARLARLAAEVERNEVGPVAPISAIPATATAHDTFPAGAYV